LERYQSGLAGRGRTTGTALAIGPIGSVQVTDDPDFMGPVHLRPQMSLATIAEPAGLAAIDAEIAR
jgi:hypothetical protein